MIKLGLVTAIDEAKCKVRIEILDNDKLQSYWLPVLQNNSKDNKFYCLPDIQELVLAVFLDNALEQGFVIGSIYNNKDTVPISNKDKYHIKFKDGTTIEYDRNSHKLLLDVKGDIQIKAQKIDIKSNDIDIDTNNFNIKSQNLNIDSSLLINLKSTNIKAYASFYAKLKSLVNTDIEGLNINVNHINFNMNKITPIPE
ncbi:MAG: phage baseplate assembly protein V [Candidatus Dojkabacteria bacterium]|nr:phage baseplate assembly protein V [Candidatus Dojkabacteria bacterium]